MTAAPTRRATPRGAIAATLVAAIALALAGCSDDGDAESTDAGADTTATTAAPEASDTTAADPSTSETTAPPTSADDGGEETEPTTADLQPGDPCSLEEGIADCIDPDGDGQGTYLLGGGDCAANAPDVVICEDLDGDGTAGYPDEYEDLPTCADDVPPPCNNPPGSGEQDAPEEEPEG